MRPRTLEEYRRLHKNHISGSIGGAELGDLTPEMLQMMINCTAKEAGDRSASAVYTLVRAVLRRAVRSRLISWSPLDALDAPRVHSAPGEAMTEDDYQAALPWITDDLGLSLALFAGLRRAEIAGLTWDQIDLRGNQIHVKQTRQRVAGKILIGPTKSDAGCRDIPISSDLRAVIQDNYCISPRAWVLPYAPEYLSRHWVEVQNHLRLSRRYRLHDLRHTYITRLILAGVVPRVVQYLAGHAAISTTMRVYTHVSAEDARRELQKLPSYTAAV